MFSSSSTPGVTEFEAYENAFDPVLGNVPAGHGCVPAATVPVAAEGQAFGWDPGEPGVLYSIGRRTREFIVGRVTPP